MSESGETAHLFAPAQRGRHRSGAAAAGTADGTAALRQLAARHSQRSHWRPRSQQWGLRLCPCGRLLPGKARPPGEIAVLRRGGAVERRGALATTEPTVPRSLAGGETVLAACEQGQAEGRGTLAGIGGNGEILLPVPDHLLHVIYRDVVEGPVTEKSLIRDDAEAPTIGALIVRLLEDLGGHVLHGADNLCETTTGRHHGRGIEVQQLHSPVAQAPGTAAARQEGGAVRRRPEADVLSLDVSVHPPFFVDVLESMKDLAEEESHRALRYQGRAFEEGAQEVAEAAALEPLEPGPDISPAAAEGALERHNVPALGQRLQSLHLLRCGALEAEGPATGPGRGAATGTAPLLHQEHGPTCAFTQFCQHLPTFFCKDAVEHAIVRGRNSTKGTRTEG
mmetsp:Transcript_23744/g.51824  ORF Transcript_23744/g.51824 Transcript_23744/m.51824 type:complete len:394 (-) Transcript_23744:9-1190(-)